MLELPFLTPLLTMLRERALDRVEHRVAEQRAALRALGFRTVEAGNLAVGGDQGVIEVDEVVDRGGCRRGVLRHGQRLRRARRRADCRSGQVQRDTLDRSGHRVA
jgi:hypothetical protein